MEYLVIFTASLFVGIILSICFVKEVKMTHFILFVALGIITIISTFCFLIFEFGLMGVIKTIYYLVASWLMLYTLCLIFEFIDYFYKKIKNFVKKLLTNKK